MGDLLQDFILSLLGRFALFILESLLLRVALFALESKGPVNTPLVVFFSFIQVLIKFQISLLRVLPYLLGGFPWGEFVASYT